LPDLEAHIKRASYASIDFEMTGLYFPSDKVNQLDSVETRYASMARGASNYKILQMGLTLSEFSPETNEIIHTPYNIYAFPSSINTLIEGNNDQGYFNTKAIEHNPILMDIG